MRAPALLEIRGLSVAFGEGERAARAVDGVDLELAAGETLALIGESGAGKSVLASAILRLVRAPGRIVAGEVRFEGRDLLALPEAELRSLRGRAIGTVFQEPATALNPVFTVGEQVSETLRAHQGLSRAEARARAALLFEKVGLPDPAERLDDYPHQLSGGMRQRAMIAIAIACGPKLLVADEPTTALDTTVQAGIVELFSALQRSEGLAILWITHALALAAETARRVAVMYAGRIVEEAPAAELFARPRHPYTVLLLRASPELASPGRRLAAIPGAAPRLDQVPSGCAFRTRCPIARARCAESVPELSSPADAPREHRAACHFPEEAARL